MNIEDVRGKKLRKKYRRRFPGFAGVIEMTREEFESQCQRGDIGVFFVPEGNADLQSEGFIGVLNLGPSQRWRVRVPDAAAKKGRNREVDFGRRLT